MIVMNYEEKLAAYERRRESVRQWCARHPDKVREYARMCYQRQKENPHKYHAMLQRKRMQYRAKANEKRSQPSEPVAPSAPNVPA